MKTGYVYILTNKRHGTLYTGVSNNIIRRMGEHRSMTEKSFTCRYSLHRLVYLETYDRILDAIARERQLKKWNRSWKIALIEKQNPQWKDLYVDICGW
ncbi:MAG: GIY-YIG nuclease family protein [Bacteroidota bacterium]